MNGRSGARGSMRLLTFQTNNTQRPGLLVDDGRIVDLTAAIAFGRDQGVLSYQGGVPGDLLGLIQAGDGFLHAVANTVC